MALVITDSNIQELLSSEKPLVVDFWAPWCGPCVAVGPVVEELAEAYEGKVNIGKLNVDENDETCSQFGIRNIPTILLFKNGQLVDKHVGSATKAVLAQKIDALLG